MNAPLFRPEVAAAKSDRLHGRVRLMTPVSWQIIGFLLVVGSALAGAFLANATYSRIETVTGTIVLDKGVAAIVPSRPGTIGEVLVRDGENVTAGTPLLSIGLKEELSGGQTASEQTRAALAEQDELLVEQSGLISEAAQAERNRLLLQSRSAAAELSALDSQIADQGTLVQAALRASEDAERLLSRGYMSRRDFEARETTLIERRQQLYQLQQQRVARASIIAESQQRISELAATASGQLAGVASTRATLRQQIAQAESTQGYMIVSPINGVVSSLTARAGQQAILQRPLALVIPAQSRLYVELKVPVTAIAFISPGQEVRLAIDSFPFQRFGTIEGRITSVARASSEDPGADGSHPYYRVTAALAPPWIEAYGRNQPLLPGMSLTARVITERRSLVGWLFEPLYAVNRR